MPRIAHVISTRSGIGGAERIVASLLSAGAAEGWEQCVLNPFADDPRDTELERVCVEADPELSFEARACRHIAQLPATRRWLANRLASASPEIVHAHLFHALVLVGSLKRPVDRATVLTHHHGDHHVAEGRRLRAAVDCHFGRRFDRVVAISEYVHEFLVGTYGYPPERIEVIRNGWSGTPLPPRPHQYPTIVCVARLRKQKGHADLLRAFALVREQVPDARLRLVGDGPLRPHLERLCHELSLDEAVNFEGDVTDIWPILAESDLFVLPSVYEPLGIAVMEAMAARLPVVATGVGGISELVDPGRTGELVAPRNGPALATAVSRLFTSPERKAFGDAAQRASRAWRAPEMANSYLSLYRRFAGCRGRDNRVASTTARP